MNTRERQLGDVGHILVDAVKVQAYGMITLYAANTTLNAVEDGDLKKSVAGAAWTLIAGVSSVIATRSYDRSNCEIAEVVRAESD